MDKKTLELFHQKLDELYALAKEHHISWLSLSLKKDNMMRLSLSGTKADVQNLIYSALLEDEQLKAVIDEVLTDIKILNLIPDEKPVHNE